MKTKFAEEHQLKSATMTSAASKTVVKLLNQSLADALDLKLQSKQAHWNIKGPDFIALHELFDRVAGQVDGYADLLAERVVQLGCIAEGTLQNVQAVTRLESYPVHIQDAQEHVKALGAAIGKFAEGTRDLIKQAAEAGDDVTVDICTEITRGMDMLYWFVTAHAVK